MQLQLSAVWFKLTVEIVLLCNLTLQSRPFDSNLKSTIEIHYSVNVQQQSISSNAVKLQLYTA
jgi:hypothetical protein